MKHTELPWKQSLDGQSILNADNHICAAGKNTPFIVKACNNHYQLLEALREVENVFSPTTEAERLTFEAAREAIKQAEGEA